MTMFAAIDKNLGCVVIHDGNNIRFIIPNGKLKLTSTGKECEDCTTADLEFATDAANSLNAVADRLAGINQCGRR